MNAKKETHPTAATVERAGQETACGARFPHSDSTTPEAGRQAVPDLLCAGEQNGKTLKQLKEILCVDGRSIRAQIEKERRDTPILSGQTGYFLPEREDEIRRFCASMRHRARRIWASASNVEKAAGLIQHEPQQLDGQGCIWAGGGSDG